MKFQHLLQLINYLNLYSATQSIILCRLFVNYTLLSFLLLLSSNFSYLIALFLMKKNTPCKKSMVWYK